MKRDFGKGVLAAIVLTVSVVLAARPAPASVFYFSGPAYLVAPPAYVYTPAYFVPQPVIVYPAPAVVYHPVVVPTPVVSYVPATPASFYHPGYFWHKQEFRGRPSKFRFKHKVYSPYKLGPVYEYEYKFDHGRIKIEVDFD